MISGEEMAFLKAHLNLPPAVLRGLKREIIAGKMRIEAESCQGPSTERKNH
jgi:hypothetical protein